jgi:hypothetical protein
MAGGKMFEVKAEQGTPEWFEARLGKITASRFKDVMTKGRGKDEKWGKTALTYRNEIISEILTGEQKEISGRALEWGTENESFAIDEYEDKKDIFVEASGLILLHEFAMIGGSPDGRPLGNCIEVKCPYNSAIHINTVLEGMPKEHTPQVQGNINFTEADWCDFISFDPRVKGPSRLYIERVFRDQEYIDTMFERLEEFQEEIEKTLQKLK